MRPHASNRRHCSRRARKWRTEGVQQLWFIIGELYGLIVGRPGGRDRRDSRARRLAQWGWLGGALPYRSYPEPLGGGRARVFRPARWERRYGTERRGRGERQMSRPPGRACNPCLLVQHSLVL
eukprot:scaffold300794_cov30-Tisochrysis_lutea.AAC.1